MPRDDDRNDSVVRLGVPNLSNEGGVVEVPVGTVAVWQIDMMRLHRSRKFDGRLASREWPKIGLSGRSLAASGCRPPKHAGIDLLAIHAYRLGRAAQSMKWPVHVHAESIATVAGRKIVGTNPGGQPPSLR